MHILEEFFSHSPKNDFFYPRKTILPESGSFSLYGARGTGKTSLIVDFTRNLPANSYLYIDCQDPLFAMEDIGSSEIELFMQEEEIDTLILDHYFDRFLEYLPKVKRVVTVSRTLPKNPPGKILELFPLDYEEFLGFDRGISAENSFNRFIRVGGLPSLSRTSPAAAQLGLRNFFYEKFDPQESRLLLVLSRFHGKRITAHHIYTFAKEYFRISKDWVYKTLERFKEEKVILFAGDEKGRHPRMFLYDFALGRYLNKTQPFAVTFESMIALALFKHKIEFHYTGSTGGYMLPEFDIAVFPAPFQNKEAFERRIKNQRRSRFGQKACVVTVSERYSFEHRGVVFEALPFYEWSILSEKEIL